MTLEWKVRSYRSENGRKIMSEDRRSLENKDFLQISQLVLHSILSKMGFSIVNMLKPILDLCNIMRLMKRIQPFH